MMDKTKVAIVTGASQGIGFAIAEWLLKEGYRVALVSRNLQNARAHFAKYGENNQAMFVPLDVSHYDLIEPCIQKVLDNWGRMDILVNNAGIRTETSIEQINREEWDRIMSVNLGGTFFFTQAVLPAMKKQRWGRIINMSSFGGQFGPLTSSAAYAASKAGQIALTKTFARAVASDGITVNAIAPASVRTPEMDKMPPVSLKKMVETIPVGRVGEAIEVAALVGYLVSDYGGFVTGATFDINGGRLMR